MAINKVNLADKFLQFNEPWSPRVVGELNGQQVKIAKFQGDFVRHHHEHEDELFYVVSGEIFIELDDDTICLQAGEMVIIPQGVPHRPYAPQEAHVMMFETASTRNTGQLVNQLTVEKPERI